MNARLRALALMVAMMTTMLVLFAGPAAAIQLPELEEDKITLPDTQRDRFGLIILGFSGLVLLGAGYNAVQQLKGRRQQADGAYRWR
jgi:hypothetical protein